MADLVFKFSKFGQVTTGTIPDNKLHNGNQCYVPYFAQGDSGGGNLWSTKPFGGKNIAYSGCSVTSLAMVTTYLLGKLVLPSDVVDAIQAKYGNYNYFYNGQTTTHEIMPGVANIYGLSCKAITGNLGSISSALYSGKPIIASVGKENIVTGTYDNGQAWSGGLSSGSGHFIVLTGYGYVSAGAKSSGLIRVNDPSHSDYSFIKFNAEEVAKNIAGHNNACWVFDYTGSKDRCKGTYDISNVTAPEIGSGAVNAPTYKSNIAPDSIILGTGLAAEAVNSRRAGFLNGAAIGSGGASEEYLTKDKAQKLNFLEWLKSLGGRINMDSAYGDQPFFHVNSGHNYIEWSEQTITREVTRDIIETYDGNLSEARSTGLLSYPNQVESPSITFKVDNFVFGTYKKEIQGSKARVSYPNYIESLTIDKVNGTVNTYVLSLVYQIQAGDDPNLVDKIFSSVGYNKAYISYGDCMSPSFAYREEEVLITKVTSQVNFSQQNIRYQVYCTSNALALAASIQNFPERIGKPSDIIKELLNSPEYGLQDVFYGMSGLNNIQLNNLIAGDDQSVKIAPKTTDPVSYINYLVTHMISQEDSVEGVVKSCTYYMCVHDDVFNENHSEIQGPYFTITKVKVGGNVLMSNDTYEVDVGYPTNNQVISFDINTDNSWSLLYKYSDDINIQQYTYDIDDNGNLIKTKAPFSAISQKDGEITPTQKTWWTNMTQFPIQARLTVKGLMRAAMLMSYVKINAFFYGQRHVSSGLYIITKQTDTVSGAGYRTTLELTRIAGDHDYIQRKQITETKIVPVISSINVKEYSAPVYEFNGLANTQFGGGQPTIYSSMAEGYHTSDGRFISSGDLDQVYNQSQYSNIGGNMSDLDIWQYLLRDIRNPYGVAGLMGNLWYESGQHTPIRFNVLEGMAKKKYKENYEIIYTDESYTAAVDKGLQQGYSRPQTEEEFKVGLTKYKEGMISVEEFLAMPWLTYSNAAKNNGTYPFGCNGYGLCQWTTASRKKGLYDLCKSRGVSIADPSTQLEYLLSELKTRYSKVYDTLKNATSVAEANKSVLYDFESPSAEDAAASIKSRQKQGENYFRQFSQESNNRQL